MYVYVGQILFSAIKNTSKVCEAYIRNLFKKQSQNQAEIM